MTGRELTGAVLMWFKVELGRRRSGDLVSTSVFLQIVDGVRKTTGFAVNCGDSLGSIFVAVTFSSDLGTEMGK